PRSTPGAFGSTWLTELWVDNASDSPLNLVGCPPVIIGGQACDGIPFHTPGVTEKAFSYELFDSAATESPSSAGPLVFSVAIDQADIVLRSRLYELSKHAQPAGVEIPVVREDQFFSRTSRFIAVPNSAAARSALRVYDPFRVGGAVRVEILNEQGTLIASKILNPIPQTIDATSAGYTALLDLASAFPPLLGVDRFNVRVVPLTPGMLYWAFVSVTDQESQTVLLVTGDQ